MKMTYIKVLQRETDRAMNTPLSRNKTRAELLLEIEQIGKALAGPLDNAERIGLCADRHLLRRELAALSEDKAEGH